MRWKHFDAQTWPDPRSVATLAWELRYGNPTKEQRLQAASVVEAYKEIFAKPCEAREEIAQRLADPKTMSTPPHASAVVAWDDGNRPRVIHRLHDHYSVADPRPACGARSPVVGWRNTSAPPKSNPCQRAKCWDGPNSL